MAAYIRLLIALVLSYGVMFAVMFSRVHRWEDIFPSLNQVYMAGLMVAPMLLIMLSVMGNMFQYKGLNRVLFVVGIVLVLFSFGLLRSQAWVGDRQFLRSMVTHHSAAVTVCERASISDPRIEELCRQIIDSQAREIRQMKALMHEPLQ